MKKIIAVFLVICLCVLTSVVGSSASGRKETLPTSAGIQALRNEFESAVGPKSNGYALDYCYYSPVGENDSTKYPVVIFLHGIGHADYEGAQLDDSDMPYWASSELQSRFDCGGAYILLPRAPENKLVYWGTTLINPLKDLIDDFIETHGDNVDSSKIFIGGSSAGGEMTWDMITSFPEYFAGAFPIAATGSVSEDEVSACSQVAIWMIASKKDPVVNYSVITTPLWNTVCESNLRPQNCRLSTFTDVVEPSGNSASDNHHLAKVVTYDLHMLDGSTYPDVTTTDGLGGRVSLEGSNGMISWMNSVSSSFDGGDSDDFDLSFIDIIINYVRSIVLKMVNIVQRILGL